MSCDARGFAIIVRMTDEGERIEIVLRTRLSLGEETEEGFRFSPLGLVVAEHVDKIAFFEPSVSVLEKEVRPDRIRFTLLRRGDAQKPLDEIIRGYRIGCFRIAREYHLIAPGDEAIFLEGT